jgi:L-malate glycosyltransferase
MSAEPTVCQVLHSLTVGGAEVLAARLARGLADRYRFVFACLDALGALGEELRADGFLVHVLERRPGVDVGCMRRLARLWREEKVDIVHAHQYTPFFYALAARRWRGRPPVLFHEHGRWFPDYRRPKRVIFNRLMLRRKDRVVGVGEAVRHALVQNEGFPDRRVGVIYNGVDPAAFNGQAIDRAKVRRNIGVGRDDLTIVQVARLDHLKDHATAMRAIHRARQQLPDLRLVLVGDGPEREKIQAEIDRLAVADRVLMLGTRHDVAELLRAADIFLLTSISEGIPVTILEAMAAGLPVVATQVGGVPEIVRHEHSGLLAPPGDDAELAKALVRLATDPGLRQRMGDFGRQRAREEFSQERMHAAYRAIYEEMLGR